jgi:hypothetical protein
MNITEAGGGGGGGPPPPAPPPPPPAPPPPPPPPAPPPPPPPCKPKEWINRQVGDQVSLRLSRGSIRNSQPTP